MRDVLGEVLKKLELVIEAEQKEIASNRNKPVVQAEAAGKIEGLRIAGRIVASLQEGK